MLFLVIKILFIFQLNTAPAHPVHLSLTSIDMNSKSKTITIHFKFFKDDFQKIIYQIYNNQINITDSTYNKTEENYVIQYLNKHFQLVASKNLPALRTIHSKLINDEAVWYIFTIPAPAKTTQWTVYNSAMCDLFADQSNMIIFTRDNESKAAQLTKKNPSVNFSF